MCLNKQDSSGQYFWIDQRLVRTKNDNWLENKTEGVQIFRDAFGGKQLVQNLQQKSNLLCVGYNFYQWITIDRFKLSTQK